MPFSVGVLARFEADLQGTRMDQDTGAVERAYRKLKEMAASFEFKPDERLNEGAISAQLSISRTPLREALNRLTAEGFLTFKRGHGFHCRSLNPPEIMDLYEARAAIESQAARLAARRADPTALAEVQAFLEQSEAGYTPGASPVELVRLDEAFHRHIALLSRNGELVRLLDNAAARIHYIRVIDLQLLSERDGTPAITTQPHARILAAVAAGDEDGAAREMDCHISRRLEEVTLNVRLAFSRIYAP
ncbi:GntR family transcriptional regulator [Roseovarius sp. Pro17]|uniref:GntR family transcriptional regulator n=1 Tax=Roseovarius sp. Pro17 TaxID=3108175 RepID=UPI002D77B98E|nr:GntR family transcriptional regulator [Roseovarius sp. Pro17]